MAGDSTDKLFTDYFTDKVNEISGRPAPTDGREDRVGEMSRPVGAAPGANASEASEAGTASESGTGAGRADSQGAARRTGRVGLVIAKVAIAAAVVATIGMPFTGRGRQTPSARMFTAIHEHFDTGRVLMTGLQAAHSFMSSYFAGQEATHDAHRDAQDARTGEESND